MPSLVEALSLLLTIYAALVAFNLVLSLALWIGNRARLYGTLCGVWFGALVSFAIQGATAQGSNTVIVLGGASIVLVVLPVAHLLCTVLEIPTPWRLWGAVYLAGCALSVLAYVSGSGFTALALPVVWGGMFSGVHTSVLCLRRWSSLSSTMRLFGIVTLVQCLHGMDYPFFRLQTEFVVGGFTIALMALLGVSILAPAVIIEKIASQNLAAVSALKNSFERFVPTELLLHLGKESILDVHLGDGVGKEMTILFADMRSFTSLSERLTPEESFKFLNSYLTRMEPVIKRHCGFIDKYMGDGILALFDRSADDAVRAATEMLRALAEYNIHRGRSGYAPIEVGIGIHTGPVLLGTVGGEARMEGTVVGDAVNLASRIEHLTTKYGVRILISEATRSRLNDTSQLEVRAVDRVSVKGRDAAVEVFEVRER